MKLARSTYYYRSRRSAAEKTLLQQRIAELSAEFPRYGYRRVTHQLRAAGLFVNHKAAARIMRQYGLQVRPLRRESPRSSEAGRSDRVHHGVAD
jgi:putative transposase